MEKFIKLNVNGSGTDSGYKLISINDIMEVKQESATVIQIFYKGISNYASVPAQVAIADGPSQAAYDVLNSVQSLKITLAADAYDEFSWKDFLNQSIETAYTLSWQQPVFTPNPSSYPKAAAAGYAPTIISSIVTGVKAAGLQS
jgi:hypothetical protein